jgi:hypothetical protein
MRAVAKRKFLRDLLWKIQSLFLKKRYKQQRSVLLTQQSKFFAQQSINDIVNQLKLKGGVNGPALPSSVVSDVHEYALNNQCFADRDVRYPFKFKEYDAICRSMDKKVLVGQYFNVQSSVPVVDQLSSDPLLLAIATEYLQAPPKLVGVNLWWTFPVEASAEDKSKHAHVFHYDLDDFKFIKFFFYITDVTENDGPHVYVEGSNRDIKYKNTWIKSKRFSDQEVINAYGEDAIKTVTGPAGSCLIEDTITLHKGTTSIGKPRLLLQLQYAINDYGVQNDYR